MANTYTDPDAEKCPARPSAASALKGAMDDVFDLSTQVLGAAAQVEWALLRPESDEGESLKDAGTPRGFLGESTDECGHTARSLRKTLDTLERVQKELVVDQK